MILIALRLIFFPLALASTPCRVAPLGEDATDIYLRVVRHLAVNRHAIDAETVQELARRDSASNPLDGARITSATLAFQKAIDANVAAVDWSRARPALAALARDLSGEAAHREDVSQKVSGMSSPRIRVPDLIAAAGIARGRGNLVFDAVAASNNVVYVSVAPRAALGPFHVAGYDGAHTTLAKIDNTQIRALLPTADGGAIVVGMNDAELHLIELPSLERTIHPLPKRLAKTLIKNPDRFFPLDVHSVENGKGGKSIAVFWKDFAKYSVDVVRLGGPKITAPPNGSFRFYSSADRQRLYAFGMTSGATELLVKDLVSGKELLREKVTGSFNCTMEESGAGEVRLAALDPQTGSFTEYELPSGKTRKHQFGIREVWGTQLVHGRFGKVSLVFESMDKLWVWHPDEPAPRVTLFPSSGAYAFTTADGRMLAARVSKGTAQVIDLESGDIRTSPLEGVGKDAMSLREVRMQPDGRVMGIVAVKGAIYEDGAAIIQLFGPMD